MPKRDPGTEAETRKLMAQCAAVVVRGFDGAGVRYRLICRIDALLDEWNGHNEPDTDRCSCGRLWATVRGFTACSFCDVPTSLQGLGAE